MANEKGLSGETSLENRRKEIQAKASGQNVQTFVADE